MTPNESASQSAKVSASAQVLVERAGGGLALRGSDKSCLGGRRGGRAAAAGALLAEPHIACSSGFLDPFTPLTAEAGVLDYHCEQEVSVAVKAVNDFLYLPGWY